MVEESGVARNILQIPLVSVVVPTYNRKAMLADTLASLAAQDYPADRYEVIVVDDGSEDGTWEWLTKETSRWSGRLIPLRQENRGPATARNVGAMSSEADVVAFIDDDCVAEPDWLPHLCAGYTSAQVGGVGGRILGLSPRTLIESYLTDMDVYRPPTTIDGQIEYFLGANASCRRDIFLSLGGFSEVLRPHGGEELDLCLRILAAGFQLVYAPHAVVWHHSRDNLPAFLRSFLYHGRGMYYCHVVDGYQISWSIYLKAFSALWWPVSVVRRLREGWGFRKSLIYPWLSWLRHLAYVLGILEGRYLYRSVPRHGSQR